MLLLRLRLKVTDGDDDADLRLEKWGAPPFVLLEKDLIRV